ncbi:ATP-grasp fold amidoligase family protein [Rhodococcus sp. H36-A4]|uniref:ATP-grasp fold amidoligase family protein n=1 Tax=Rhodococcus sp. H36-A4 TaxID=3004353 RepID=UPI0022AE903A|nr:ATP-grasp fold amidoligase family protein [Rhodococcus sp. H36-A4]MCZ4076504.1 ATP-grasp fold amidoligase family protein [Rhodococcus sp. H36-A4]
MRYARWRERSTLVRGWRLLRTRRPVTFTDKVKYKMLRDHRDLLVEFADKAAMRGYVTSVLGEGYLPAAYALLDDPGQLAEIDLPTEYVSKPTHGSGAVVVVSDKADPVASLPPVEACWSYTHVRPGRVDRGQLVEIASYWLDQLYGQGPNREWAYGRIPRRIIVEELLTGPGGGVADDYKLFVFHGRCEFIQVDTGRFGRRTQDFYRKPWTHLPLSGGPPHADPPYPQPELLGEMIDVAERLARSTDFVRVDLYVVGSRIVVGELTSYPAGGHSPFSPESFDEEFGRFWTVPRRYDNSTQWQSRPTTPEIGEPRGELRA